MRVYHSHNTYAWEAPAGPELLHLTPTYEKEIIAIVLPRLSIACVVYGQGESAHNEVLSDKPYISVHL